MTTKVEQSLNEVQDYAAGKDHIQLATLEEVHQYMNGEDID